MTGKKRQNKSRHVQVILLFAVLFSFLACTPRIDEELRRAAIKGDADQVKFLLNKGADLHMKKGGWTVLMFRS